MSELLVSIPINTASKLLELAVSEIQHQDARVWTEKQDEYYTSRLTTKWRDIPERCLSFDPI